MTETRTLGLLDQQLALSAYLDALLTEAPAVEPVAEAAPAPAPPTPKVVTQAKIPTPAPVVAPTASPVEVPVVMPVVTPVPVAEPAPAPPVQAAPEAPADLRPEWARSDFQLLLFQVAGLTLAVPLARLNGVIPLDFESVTPMPGHSALFLGLVERQEQKVKVVDTAQVVLPPDRLAGLDPDPAQRVSHLVLIGEGRWGLAASGIGEVVSLAPDDVKWRSTQGKRPWLAGTVLAHMCALLDVDAFITLLARG